jgi:hypothetical protein
MDSVHVGTVEDANERFAIIVELKAPCGPGGLFRDDMGEIDTIFDTV